MSKEDRIKELKEELTALEMEEGEEEKEKRKITEKDVSKGCLYIFLGGIALFFGIAIIGIIIDDVQTTSKTKNSNWQTGDNPWDHPKANDAQYKCARLVSGRPGESHPQAPTEPYVNLSIHTALPMQTAFRLLPSPLFASSPFGLGR